MSRLVSVPTNGGVVFTGVHSLATKLLENILVVVFAGVATVFSHSLIQCGWKSFAVKSLAAQDCIDIRSMALKHMLGLGLKIL